MKDVEIFVSRACPSCDGTGTRQPDTQTIACPRCKGVGRLIGTISLDELAQLLSEQHAVPTQV